MSAMCNQYFNGGQMNPIWLMIEGKLDKEIEIPKILSYIVYIIYVV